MNLPRDNFNLDSDGEDDVKRLEKAKSKLIMDFGLEQPKLERVTLQVLQQLIEENPERMSQAIRRWLRPDKPGN